MEQEAYEKLDDIIMNKKLSSACGSVISLDKELHDRQQVKEMTQMYWSIMWEERPVIGDCCEYVSSR